MELCRIVRMTDQERIALAYVILPVLQERLRGRCAALCREIIDAIEAADCRITPATMPIRGVNFLTGEILPTTSAPPETG